MKLILSSLFCLAVICGAGAATYLKTGDPVVSGGVAGFAGILGFVLLAPFFRKRGGEARPAEDGTSGDSVEDAPARMAEAIPAAPAEPPAPAPGIELAGKFSEAQKKVISDYLHKADLPPAKWPNILNHCENLLQQFETKLGKTAEENPQLTHVLADAYGLFATADFIGAETLLAKAGEAAPADRAVQLLELRAALARASGRPTNAAHLYSRAADMLGDPSQREWVHLKAAEAESWLDRGRFANEADTLARSVRVYDEAASGGIRETAPYLWASIQDSLGQAQRTLGERTGNTDSLRASVDAFQRALDVKTKEAAPVEWGRITVKRGGSLQVLAETGDAEARAEAIRCYSQALDVLSETSAPYFHRLAKDGLKALQQNA